MLSLDELAVLFKQHTTDKMLKFREIMQSLNIERLVIASGETKTRYADDMGYPFKASPYFREWLPLDLRSDCFIVLENEHKPVLYLYEHSDFWHSVPQSLPKGWESNFIVKLYKEKGNVFSRTTLTADSTIFLGPENSFDVESKQYNPEVLCRNIDLLRQRKSPYEQYCIKHANELAVVAHQSAKNSFYAKGSELDIKLAFLSGAKQNEHELPYDIIAGVNENAAILHHKHASVIRPDMSRSMLIDAGVSFHSYASDITRTYAYEQQCEFANILADMDVLQQRIVDEVKPGTTYAALNEFTHIALATLLSMHKIVTLSAEETFTKGITKTFMPHGFGHGLGVNVHERGAGLRSADGERYRRSDFGFEQGLNDGEVITVEPGLYFIPMLLDKLLVEHAGSINIDKINALIPYGGIRIEDNILVKQDGGFENYTRDAFKAFEHKNTAR